VCSVALNRIGVVETVSANTRFSYRFWSSPSVYTYPMAGSANTPFLVYVTDCPCCCCVCVCMDGVGPLRPSLPPPPLQLHVSTALSFSYPNPLTRALFHCLVSCTTGRYNTPPPHLVPGRYGNLLTSIPNVLKVNLGDSLCVVPESTEAVSTSYIQLVNCTLPTAVAGPRNLTIAVDPRNNKGGASIPRDLWQVSVEDGTPRMFVLHANIERLSTSSGGLLGGAPLTITGTGFDPVPSNNVVKVGGVPCAVTASTPSTVTCTLGPSNATGPPSNASTPLYPGGRGLLVQFFDFPNNDFFSMSGQPLANYVSRAGFPERSWSVTWGAVGAGGRLSYWGALWGSGRGSRGGGHASFA
jgi:hypothetical protein